ncbi:Tn3 family transposase [Nocardiopsis endophytica]|uniref:Tn3 family transposase n=1 Tax=Nocardiopsis endophytica TaxID=3018445 RepID=UPI0038CDA5F1
MKRRAEAARFGFQVDARRGRRHQGDQLGALGLVLNAVVWWNSLYIDVAVTRLRAEGFPATEEMCARLSPLGFDHITRAPTVRCAESTDLRAAGQQMGVEEAPFGGRVVE